MQEKTVQEKVCKHCLANFEITDKDLEFYEKISPSFASPSFEGDGGGVKKYLIPPPTLCPDCRQQRRLSFRNERKLYKRKCDATGKDIISMYSPEKKFKVYENFIWKSDAYNPFDYGIDFDFNKNFFEHISILLEKTPKQSLFASRSNENSNYTNYCSGMKDCYLINDSMNSSFCFYGLKVSFCDNCVNCYYLINSSNCYSCNDCMNCHNLYYSSYSNNCNNSEYLNDCVNCDFCFMCKGLRNKKYYIKNKEFTKEEYFKQLEKVKNLTNLEEDFKKFCESIITRALFMNASDKSSGNNLNNSVNSNNCFDSFEINNSRYCYRIHTSQDCYDYESWGEKSSLMYEVIGAGGNSNRVLFGCCNMTNNINSVYCMFSSGCKNCFGCVNLKDSEYCILNKQYTKEEYEILVPKIIEHMKKTGEWGEFFPSSLSPFGYNETVAMEYFPLSKQDVSEKHLYKDGKQIFNWSNYEAPFPKVEKIIKAELLPDDISKIPDDILNWAIECEVTKKPFRIIKQELDFYRKHNLPIPKRHPDQRHLDRMKLRNPRKLFDRKCDKCGVAIKTTYSPEREEIVYCEECYNKEIY